MKVIRNYLYNAGYQILAMILPLITAPYVSRVLTPHGYGLNTYTNSIVQYFVLFGSIGIALYGNREIAYTNRNRQEMSKTFWEIQILKTVAIIIATGAYFLFLGFYRTNHLLMIFQTINLLAAAFDISWFFMGIEDFKRTVIRNTLVKLASLVLIFTFVKKTTDLPLYILILGGSLLIGNFTLWPPLRRELIKVKFSSIHPMQHLKPTIGLFVPQIATQVYVVLNKTMLGAMVGPESAGFYFSADNLIKVVLSIVTATGTVMLPHAASAFAKGETEKINEYLYVSFDFISFIAVPMSFGLGAVGIRLGPLFYGKGYEPVGWSILLEAVVIVLIGWSNAVGTQFLLPTKRVKQFTKSVLSGAIVNIILNVPLIFLWGLQGAIIATVISELVVTSYQLMSIRHIVNVRKLFNNVGKYCISGIVMFIPVFVINLRFKPSFILLFLEVLLGMFIYGLMILITRPTILIKLRKLVAKIQS